MSEPIRLHRVAIAAREQATTDPVCGMHVSPEAALRHADAGPNVLFCSEGCRALYVAAPERYVT